MITITGPNSFIGKNFINFLNKKNIKNSFLSRKKSKTLEINLTIIILQKEQKKTN